MKSARSRSEDSPSHCLNSADSGSSKASGDFVGYEQMQKFHECKEALHLSIEQVMSEDVHSGYSFRLRTSGAPVEFQSIQTPPYVSILTLGLSSRCPSMHSSTFNVLYD